MPSITYVLSDAFASGVTGATIQYNNGLTFDVLAALVAGGGNAKGVGGAFAVTDLGLISALDSDPTVKRSGTSSPSSQAVPRVGPLIASLMNPAVGETLRYRPDGLFHNEAVALLPLAPVKTKLAKQEGLAAPPAVASPNNVRTVFTDTGAGVIRSIWFACDMGTASWDARLQIFVDGEATPSVDIDLGTLWMYHNNVGNKDGLGMDGTPLSPHGVNLANVPANRQPPAPPQITLPHLHVERMGASFCSGMLRFPVPYSSGITIQLMNPGSGVGNNVLFFQVHYQPGVTLPYRLKSFGRSWNALASPGYTSSCPGSKILVPHDQDVNLIDVTVAKSSWLAWFGMCSQATFAGNGYYWLERNYQITVDDEAVPSYLSSGTEDFFQSSYYWQNQNYSANGVGAAFAANYTDAIANAGIDFLELCDGIRFEQRLKLDNLQEQARTGASEHNMSYVGLYYMTI